MEVVKGALIDLDPVGDIVGVGQRRRQAHNPDLVAGHRRHEMQARHDHLTSIRSRVFGTTSTTDFENRAAIATKKVQFVDNDEADTANVVAFAPAS